jgi:germination protein M
MARKRNTIGCLFYVALVLLVLVVFLFNRTRVQQVIEKTGFARLFQKGQAAPAQVVVTPPAAAPEGAPPAPPGSAQGSTPGTRPGSRPGSTPAPARESPPDVIVELVKPSAGAQPDREVGAQPDGETRQGGRREVGAQQPAGSKGGETPSPRTRQARLFFISVKPDGEIELKSVIRPVKYTDAPLTSTLEALLAGPTPAEVNQGLISLVAPASHLRRAQVKDGTAYLDFSEDFRFNSLGKEGLSAQLQQVVYSATEFPTVKRVQILLEGKIADYLGPEGLFIGKPLSRDSFQR